MDTCQQNGSFVTMTTSTIRRKWWWWW